MPTYQYVCTNPDEPHEFERVQSFTDAAVSECPVCGAPVRKRYGSVGVVFKGSGFYRNDSRGASTSSSEPAKSEGKSDAKAGAGEKSGSGEKASAGASSSGSSSSSGSGSASSSSSGSGSSAA